MAKVLNHATFLLVAGMLQPAGAYEIHNYLDFAFKGNRDLDLPDVEAIHSMLMKMERDRLLIRVDRNPDLFSLTERGNASLPKPHRLVRDKLRLYLLKDHRSATLAESREGIAQRSGGVSPSLETRPSAEGPAAKGTGRCVPSGQFLWPLLSRQFSLTGSSHPPRDTQPFPYLSFSSLIQLRVALGGSRDIEDLDYIGLGLVLGISPALLSSMTRNPKKYYNTFSVEKKSGGKRKIESPKVFLKVVQYFLEDYFISGLPVNENVFSYKRGTSIADNANVHIEQPYVSNIDIEDFFGSIKMTSVENLLIQNGLPPKFSKITSHLCTKDGSLPQGAPTSPSLSNAYLIRFDSEFSDFCHGRQLRYSRYADDITISGTDQVAIKGAISTARNMLRSGYGLKLNQKKTRIAPASRQQRVTGLVVNSGTAHPPRAWRRRVRAEFHEARKKKVVDKKKHARLSGYLNYLKGFKSLRNSREIKRYQETLASLKTKSKTQPS